MFNSTQKLRTRPGQTRPPSTQEAEAEGSPSLRSAWLHKDPISKNKNKSLRLKDEKFQLLLTF
jgi:hypothetical protein